MDILQRFLSTCESLTSPATAFAVHCRSGLGRTATLIGAYAIRHCGFTARALGGKYMVFSWENHGKIMGKSWDVYGKMVSTLW